MTAAAVGESLLVALAGLAATQQSLVCPVRDRIRALTRRGRHMLALLILMAVSLPAAAHDSRPLYIELTETAPQHYQLQWKPPPSVPSFNIPVVTLSEACQQQGPLVEIGGLAGAVHRTSYRCPHGVAGQRLTIAYPGPNPSLSSLMRFRGVLGERHTVVLGPQDTTWTVPRAETASGVAWQYTVLGIEHIWAGIDHLLFLVCLLWVARTWRRIVITITGFTLAHSVTLILSTFNLVRLPIPPVEATIALSVVFLATEIAKGPRQSLIWRYPVAVSSSFGLLHGFGFAAALSDIGVPQIEKLTGLLFFNVGVELGQVLFAVGVIGLMWLLQRLSGELFKEAGGATLSRTLAGYAVGVLATFWLVERCAAFWTGAS